MPPHYYSGDRKMIVPYIYNGVTYNLDETSMIATDTIGNQFLVDQSGNMTPLQGQTGLSTIDSITQSATNIFKSVISTVQQNDLNKLNIERARQGLPPLNATQYTGLGATAPLSNPNAQLFLLGGIALIAILALRK